MVNYIRYRFILLDIVWWEGNFVTGLVDNSKLKLDLDDGGDQRVSSK